MNCSQLGRLRPALIRIPLICAATWIADAASKCWALNHDHARIITVIPEVFYALVPPVMNDGTGCLIPGVTIPGSGPFMSQATIVFPILLSLAGFVWIYQIEQQQAQKLTVWEQVGFGMLLGGTFSNIYDRFVQHSVTDFLSTPIWGGMMWNVADAGVAAGLFIVGIEALRLGRLLRTAPSRQI